MTMDVYDHITNKQDIKEEVERMPGRQGINTPKKKNGVKMVYNICYMDFIEILEPANPHKHWVCEIFCS